MKPDEKDKKLNDNDEVIEVSDEELENVAGGVPRPGTPGPPMK